jgi:hypothetical protein
LHPLCLILQYADDLVVCISKKHVEAVRDCLQTSLTIVMTWFGDLGLSLSANKSEVMVFSRKNKIILHKPLQNLSSSPAEIVKISEINSFDSFRKGAPAANGLIAGPKSVNSVQVHLMSES